MIYDLARSPLVWLIGAVNLYGLGIMGWDKHCARHHRRRVPEKRLWLTALCAGAVGVLAGMMVFRHKTQHLSFVIGVPLLVIFQGWLAWQLIRLLF
ncbi:MAG: DUF1294 domain-containing protein [Bacillota bacterium]